MIWTAIKEIGATAFCLMLYPFKSAQLDHPAPEIAAKPNVLCVHGYLHNETAWGFYRRQLQKAGLGPVDALCYPSIRWDIAENSTIVRDRVEQIKNETGKEVYILIGHSLGGLVCLEYALEYAPRDRITYVITLGSPLHGTKMTRFGYGPSVDDMQVNSEYLQSLHARLAKARHLRVLSLAAASDQIILPRQSALLAEYPFATTEVIKDLGHIAFLFSKEAVAHSVNFLRREGVEF